MLPTEHAKWTNGPSFPHVKPAEVEKIYIYSDSVDEFLVINEVIGAYHADALDKQVLDAQESFDNKACQNDLDFRDTGSGAVVGDFRLRLGFTHAFVIFWLSVAVDMLHRPCSSDHRLGRIFDHQRGNQGEQKL